MKALLRQNYDYWNHERSLTALLTYLAVAVLAWISLGDMVNIWWAETIGDLAFYLIILAGVFSVFVELKRQFFFVATAVAAGLLRTTCHFFPSFWLLGVQELLAFLYFSMLARHVFKRIFRDGPMTFYRIQGSVVVFLLIGVMYAMIYTMLERIDSNSLHVAHGEQAIQNVSSQMLYFSFVIMTTLGIGDVIPNTPIAKALVVFQGMVGLLYPVIMIARLVSLEVSHRHYNG